MQDSFTEHELELLPKFRERLSDVTQPHHDDNFLVKWLRARNHNMDKSEAMFRKSMKWRAENHIDTILEDYKIPEVMSKYYPGGLFGEDREGRPIWIDPFGKLDCKGVLFSVKKSDIIRTNIYRCEILSEVFRQQSKKHGRYIGQCVHLLDMEGFGSGHLWKPVADIYIEILNTMEANYPETLRRSYVINVPKPFYVAYNFIKQFLPEETKKKFILMEKGRWQSTVFKDIDPDVLPVHYGGKQTDPDGNGKCVSKICYGGPVPEQYFSNKQSFFPKGVRLKNETVGRNSGFRADFEIFQKNVALRYIFSTEGGEVHFGVYRQTAMCKQKVKDMDVIEAMHRVNCHMVPEDGTTICDVPGVYVLVFSNPSLLSKRKLMYYVEVIKGDGQTQEVHGSSTAHASTAAAGQTQELPGSSTAHASTAAAATAENSVTHV